MAMNSHILTSTAYSFPSSSVFNIRIFLLLFTIFIFLFPFNFSLPPPPVRLYGCLVFDHLKQVLQIPESAVHFLPHKLVRVYGLFLINPSSANEHFAKVFRISGNNAIRILLKKSAGGNNGCSAVDTGQRVEVSERGDV